MAPAKRFSDTSIQWSSGCMTYTGRCCVYISELYTPFSSTCQGWVGVHSYFRPLHTMHVDCAIEIYQIPLSGIMWGTVGSAVSFLIFQLKWESIYKNKDIWLLWKKVLPHLRGKLNQYVNNLHKMYISKLLIFPLFFLKTFYLNYFSHSNGYFLQTPTIKKLNFSL